MNSTLYTQLSISVRLQVTLVSVLARRRISMLSVGVQRTEKWVLHPLFVKLVVVTKLVTAPLVVHIQRVTSNIIPFESYLGQQEHGIRLP